MGAGSGLSAHVGIFAERQNHQIRLPRSFDRRGNLFIVAIKNARAMKARDMFRANVLRDRRRQRNSKAFLVRVHGL